MKQILPTVALIARTFALDVHTWHNTELQQSQTTYTVPYYFSNKIPFVNFTFPGTDGPVPLMLDLQNGQPVAWQCNNSLCA